MTDIVDKSTFDTVPLIEVGESVLGGLNGAANKQGIALANRTKFLNEKVNQLGPADVGADPKGDAANKIAQHSADPDAHPQYLKATDGDGRYLQLQGANLPNGAVLLDATGKIPSMYLDLIQSSYVAVANQAARLALPKTSNLTIAAQVDIDTLFYLNGNLDPAVAGNWVQGQAATVSGVSRVFNRTGNITAQSGDYTADQITETATRVFTSPTEKAGWSGKQDKLVSGTNLLTLAGKSLLGAGNLTLVPDDLGAAAKVHKHEIADVNLLADALSQASSKNLVPGRGISLTTDPNTKKVTIDLLNGGTPLAAFIVADRQNAVAGQTHNFGFQENGSYSFAAYALKEIAGATGQITPIETFPVGNAGNYDQTPNLVFNNGLSLYIGETLTMSKEGSLYRAGLKLNGSDFKLDSTQGAVLPYLVSSNSENGITVSASSIYSAAYDVFKAFNGTTGSGSYWCSQSGTGAPTDANPQWLMITPPSTWNNIPIGYSLTSLNGDGNAPSSWKIQGRNDDNTWTDLDTKTNYSPSRTARMDFTLTANKAYKSYRMLITKADSTANWMRVDELSFTFAVEKNLFLRDKDGVYYTLNASNALTTIAASGVVSGAGFSSLPVKTNASVASLLPLDVVSTGAAPVKLTVTPVNGFFKTKAPFAISNYQKLSALTFSFNAQTGGELYLAVTRNGTDYFTWNGTSWDTLALTGDIPTDTATLLSKGNKRTVLNALTAANLALLYNDKVDNLGFVGVLVNGTAVTASVLSFASVTGDLRSNWKLQTPAEVEIARGVGVLSFKTVTAGNYKLAYQFL